MEIKVQSETKRLGRGLWAFAVGMGIAVLIGWGVACQWTVPGRSFHGVLPPSTPPQVSLAKRLEADVRALCDDIGQRNIQHPQNMKKAEAYLVEALTRSGFVPERQAYTAQGVEVANVEAEIQGAKWPDQIMVVGAHYDSFFGTVGANDNASGTAALLAMARHFKNRPLDRTVRFVFFANEEPPFFQTNKMGSVVYATRCKQRHENIVGVISFDGLGYYSEAANSQNYPFPFSLLYPSTGNFIAVVGNTESSDWVHRVTGAFRKHAAFPSEAAAIPAFVQGAGWSDHWAFCQQGYAGVMITDTLPFRYVHYHQTTDTPDRLDYAKMARVVEGVQRVVEDLANAGPSKKNN